MYNREILRNLYKCGEYKKIADLTGYIFKFDKNILRIYENNSEFVFLEGRYINTQTSGKFRIKSAKIKLEREISLKNARKKLISEIIRDVIKREL